MIKMNKRFFSSLLVMSLTLSLTGCGKNIVNEEENIELLDPVDVKVETVNAEYRDVLDGVVYSGKVVPEITEISFSSSQNFLNYGALLGSDVKKGEAVVYASTDSIDEQIKNLKEKIKNDDEAYMDSMKEMQENFSKLKHDLEYWEAIYKRITEEDLVHTQNYSEALANEQIRTYQSVLSNYEHAAQNIKKTEGLYNIDSKYSATQLKRLTSKRSDVLATANMDGTIVSVNYYTTGDYIEKDTSVAAIGDLNSLVIESTYISKSDINKAKRFYAIINGVKYDVEYEALDKDQYNQMKESNETVHSTFRFLGSHDEVQAGDYVTIVLVNHDEKGVLSLPNSAINKDEQGYFVYVKEGESSVYVPVKTGNTSGLYTEILSGIDENDDVIASKVTKKTKNPKTLTTGEVYNDFKQTGYLYYPKREWITNPVKYGTTYIKEVLVTYYERVEKGQPIATVSVVPNTVDISRQERYLLRAKEDLERFLKDNKEAIEKEDEKILKQLNNKKESIKDLEDLIKDMKKDAVTEEIVAPFSGIITDLRWGIEEGDILWPGTGIAQISSEEDSFVYVEDEKNLLSYGNVATISYNDANGKPTEVEGVVVSITPEILSNGLKRDYAVIKVDPEALESMAGSAISYENRWNRDRFKVSVKARKASNVILVPKGAVTREGDLTYVSVLDENGNSKLVSFIAGGSDVSYYWVCEGLLEGTEVCLE